ncbi:hypothetical protein [Gracilimonas sp.]|uniref:hypothetical protein n=1 Tax=Gracilimonas sp. TaxID=1974203 RepID=UPI0032EE743A
MSTHKKNIEEEVQKTLNALDGIEKASTDDFFYSRLSARLENREVSDSRQETSFNYGFAFSAAAVFIVLMLNLISIIQYEPESTTGDSELNREGVMEQLASEYEVVDLNYYQTFEEE